MLRTSHIVASIGLAATAHAVAEPVDGNPGTARAQVRGENLTLANRAIGMTWSTAGGRLTVTAFRDGIQGQTLALKSETFAMVLQNAELLKAGDLRIVGTPVVENMKGARGKSKLSERLSGKKIVLTLEDEAKRLRATWRGVLRDGSNYIRQELTIEALGADLPLKEVKLIDLPIPGGSVVGTVPGSPVVAGNMFLGFEHPLSLSSVEGDRATCRLERALPLPKGQSVTYSSFIGVAPKGQMRRAFLNYLERERAHPYRPFLHYNSWYDLGYGNPFNESESLEAIEAIGKELVVKRRVKLDSLLFDDGWDDPQTLWGFHKGFPNGFSPVKALAAKYGTAPGVWLSPWGGYGASHDKRIAFGKNEGFEIVDGGFALSGPVYYRRFHDTCVKMIREYGVNHFKFDGTGNVNHVIPGSEFGSDFEAMIALITDLRDIEPSLFINLTTGTWPTPFWTRYADSIWRGGADNGFAGVGSNRQKWITYRDGDTYNRVVKRGPLYPLNSLMLHGLLYGRFAPNLSTDPNDDLADEIRTFFGSGTQLQELYLTPSLLSPKNWDDLAEAAVWSRKNARILVDTHWVGGDPLKLEAYGWAAWSPGKSILTLRNPSDKPQTITIDVQTALELPAGSPTRYQGRSPWKSVAARLKVEFAAGSTVAVALKPFEVVTYELTALK